MKKCCTCRYWVPELTEAAPDKRGIHTAKGAERGYCVSGAGDGGNVIRAAIVGWHQDADQRPGPDGGSAGLMTAHDTRCPNHLPPPRPIQT